MYLRHPIPTDARILLYGRFSTEEQRRQSITDQHDYCMEFLAENGATLDAVESLSDEGMSGELRSRPGIDQVREGILQRSWDILICEDSSRLFRGMSACLELVELAVDHDRRVIFINDHVDTADDDWKNRLEEAQRHHGQDNTFTRFRIKRAQDGLWRSGAALGAVRSGYQRAAQVPDNPRSQKQDQIDPQWKSTIVEAFSRVANGVPLSDVADYLNQQRLPKVANSKSPLWNKPTVMSMIRCPTYRGIQEYRKTISKKVHTTGKSRNIPNPDSGKILRRDMPHLRIVEDGLWYRANAAIDNRARKGAGLSGAAHPLFRVPRDSRSPLSNLFVCGICGNKMHMTGRNEGGYRCGVAKRGDCWNLATSLRDLTHQRISSAVSSAILEACPDIIDPLMMHIESVLSSRGDLSQRTRELQSRRTDLQRKQQNLLRLTENEDETPAFLTDRLTELGKEEAQLTFEEQELASLTTQNKELPGRDVLIDHLNDTAERTAILNRETGWLLQQLLHGPIQAIPCQQLGSGKIVLRAKLSIQLAQALPADVRRLLKGTGQMPEGIAVVRRDLMVNLFEPSLAPLHAMHALAFYNRDPERHATLEQIRVHLGISKRSADLALQLGRKLRAAGLSDPFVELTARPENAARWRPKK